MVNITIVEDQRESVADPEDGWQSRVLHSTWKTWKNENTPGKPGNIMEF